MPLVIPSGFSNVTLEFTTPKGAGYHRSFVSFGVTGDPALTPISNFVGQLNVFLPDALHDATTFIGGTMYNETTSYFRAAEDGQGTRSGAASPPQVCTLVRKDTALRGRKFAGRNYWPGLLLDEDVTDSGTLSGGRLSALGDLIDGIATDIVADFGGAVILHNDPGTEPTEVIGFRVEPTVATQRRRLR